MRLVKWSTHTIDNTDKNQWYDIIGFKPNNLVFWPSGVQVCCSKLSIKDSSRIKNSNI